MPMAHCSIGMKHIRQQIPMRRIRHGEEIANAALFLATTDCSC
jgi:hypothetical protein